MKKIFFITTLIFIFSFTLPTFSFAQGMMGNITGTNSATLQNDDGLPAEASAQAGHTAREEAEGKAVWEKLQAKELTCKNLSNDDFGTLGEYFMGQMMGNSHEAMNNMMIRMMGKDGEEQMHIVMGKRMSGCDWSKGGGNSMMGNFYGNMMNNSWGLFGGLTWILVVVFLLLGIVYFWKGINK